MTDPLEPLRTHIRAENDHLHSAHKRLLGILVWAVPLWTLLILALGIWIGGCR